MASARSRRRPRPGPRWRRSHERAAEERTMTEIAGTAANVASAWIDGLIASNRGSHHAFAYAQKRYSYTDVAALMNRAGNLMRALGLGAGAPVLVLLPGSP